MTKLASVVAPRCPRHSRGRAPAAPRKMPAETAATWSASTGFADHLAGAHPLDAVAERHPAAGDRGGAGAAVGLDDVAIDRDLALAEADQIDHGAERAADQALDLQRPAGLLAGRRLAARALGGGARQHAVFGGDPALAAAAQPGRHLARRGSPCTAHGCRRSGPGRSPRHAWRRRARGCTARMSSRRPLRGPGPSIAFVHDRFLACRLARRVKPCLNTTVKTDT